MKELCGNERRKLSFYRRGEESKATLLLGSFLVNSQSHFERWFNYLLCFSYYIEPVFLLIYPIISSHVFSTPPAKNLFFTLSIA